MPDLILRLVRIYLGEQRMDVAMDDKRTDSQRLVQYSWSGDDDVPPENWWESVRGEVQYQRSQDLKRASGRLLPGM